jgi:hypothetical protein
MMGSFRRHRWSRAMLGAVAGFAIVTGSAQFSATLANEDDDPLPDVKILRSILKGLGLRRDGEAEIEYRERSPLVLPPSTQLPPPERNLVPQSAADWPKDPDVERARQARAAARVPVPDEVERDRALRPDELNVPGAPRRSRAAERPSAPWEDPDAPLSNRALGAKSPFSFVGKPKEEYATFTREPSRSSLTQPPPGYRTPSPSQPYGVGKEKWKPPEAASQHIPRD